MIKIEKTLHIYHIDNYICILETIFIRNNENNDLLYYDRNYTYGKYIDELENLFSIRSTKCGMVSRIFYKSNYDKIINQLGENNE